MGLYIRWQQDPALDDLGNRPAGGLAPGSVYWLSPDLKISGGIDEGTAKAGITQQIQVDVRNNSGQAMSASRAQIWVARFGVGGAHALQSVGPGFDRGRCTVGTTLSNPCVVPAATAAGPGRALFEADWMPAADEAGHCCLMANVYAGDPTAPTDGGPVTVTDVGPPPVEHVFNLDIPHDAHHAQRNIEVAAATPSVPPPKFHVWSPTIHDADFELEVVERPGKFDRADLALLNSNRAFQVRPGLLERDGGLLRPVAPLVRSGVDLLDPLARRLGLGTLFNRLGGEVLLMHPELPVAVRPAPDRPRNFGIRMGDRTARRLKLQLERGEQRELHLDLVTQPRPRPGIHRFDIIQRHRGAVTSGARILAVVGDDTMLREALRGEE